MDDQILEANPLSDLESRQDDLLRRLAELDSRVEKALSEWLSEKAAERN